HDERYAMFHQTADVVDVAGEPIELRHNDRCLALAGERDRSRQSGAITIVTLAADRLRERVDELVTLGLRKTCQGFLLRLKAQPAAALLGRRDPDIANGLFHRITSSANHEDVTPSCNKVKQNVLQHCSAGAYAVMVTRRSAVCLTGKPRRIGRIAIAT